MFLPHLYFQVCYALSYMATGSYYAVIRDTQGGCSRSSIGRAVSAFTRFLAAKSRRHIRFPKVLITFAILLACYCFKSISHLKMHPTLSILILMLNDFLPPNKLAVYKSIESHFYKLKSQPIHQQYIKLHIIQDEPYMKRRFFFGALPHEPMCRMHRQDTRSHQTAHPKPSFLHMS